MHAIRQVVTSIKPETPAPHITPSAALPTCRLFSCAGVPVQIFSDAPDNARWIVPIHHAVVHNMVATATQADQAQRQAGHAAPGKLSAAATYLQSSIFSDTLRKGDLL